MAKPGPKARPVHERFQGKYEIDQSGCWLWIASRDRRGYGKIGIGRDGMALAHRVSYEIHIGPIPEGMEIDHLCRVRHCVNPAHLEAVTHTENVRRGAQAQKQCKHGHPYDTANTRIDKRGHRECCICRRGWSAKHRELLAMARTARPVCGALAHTPEKEER